MISAHALGQIPPLPQKKDPLYVRLRYGVANPIQSYGQIQSAIIHSIPWQILCVLGDGGDKRECLRNLNGFQRSLYLWMDWLHHPWKSRRGDWCIYPIHFLISFHHQMFIPFISYSQEEMFTHRWMSVNYKMEYAQFVTTWIHFLFWASSRVWFANRLWWLWSVGWLI